MEIDFKKYNNTLFLDRDGVINKHRPNDYVKSWEEFEFLPGVLNALTLASRQFQYVIVVSNQRGVGKGLMSEKDMMYIHKRMIDEIERYGGRIDKVYCCTAIADSDPCRKPNPGMAVQAKKDFPDIDFSRSIMVGDSASDEKFAEKTGLKMLYVNSNNGLKDLFYDTTKL
jgi:histidinol-phosphate phosphatase family protein